MPYDQNKSQGHGHYQMKKTLGLFILAITLCSITIGQNKILLENGSSMNYSGISVEKDLVKVTVNGEIRSIAKTDVLCVIPEKGRSFTFMKKNNVKFKIAKNDMKNGYEGADIARIFAYKYYKSDTDISAIHKIFQGIELTLSDFETYFNTQQRKIRSRATTATIIGVVVLVISVGGLVRVLGDANAVTYNQNDCPEINCPEANFSAAWLSGHRYCNLKYCV